MSAVHPASPGAALRIELVSYRRRWRNRVFMATVPLLLPGAIAAGAVLARLTGAGSWLMAAWSVAAGIVGVVLSALWSVARTPSLPATARNVDRLFHLDDRIVTALQFADAEDAFSRLVVEEALRDLARRRRAPLPTGHRSDLLWITSAAAAGLVLLAAVGTPTLAWPTMWPGQTVAASDGVSDQAGWSVPNPAPSREGEPTSAARGTGSIAPSQPGSTASADNAAPQRGSVSGVRQAIDPSSRSGGPGSSGLSPSGTPRGTASASASSSDVNPTGRAAWNPGAGRGGDSGRMSGAGGGGATTRAETIGNGGAHGAASIGQAERTAPRPAPAGSAYATQYAAARAQAEAAIAHQRVPLHLRASVRAYFLAIQPAGRQ